MPHLYTCLHESGTETEERRTGGSEVSVHVWTVHFHSNFYWSRGVGDVLFTSSLPWSFVWRY